MKRTLTWTCKRSWLIATLLCLTTAVSDAQIRYLTIPTRRSPLPAMPLLPAQSASGALPAPSTAPPSAPPVLIVPVKPSLDKDELQRRVVVFQKQRAEEGSASAQYELGVRYSKGDGVEKDLAAARKWLSLAAENGFETARKKLVEIGAGAVSAPTSRPKTE